jgi:NADPH2:quinone reductase
MRALVCDSVGSLDALRVRDLPVPSPAARQVRIAVHAASLNQPDILMVQGKYQVSPPVPFVPGIEFAGTVDAVGAEVTRVKPGDRVVAIGLGGLGEFALADEVTLCAVPQSMPFEDAAAFFVTYCTSLRGLRQCAHLQPGETLLVLGASGGVGLAAVEIGKAMGATVIAAASSRERLERCLERGADHVIDYSHESLRERLDAVTAKRGVDVVYDPVGGELTEQALRALRWRGRLVVVGFATGTIPKLPANLLLLRERTVVGVYWGDSVAREPVAQADNVRQLLEWYALRRIAPLISERVPLDRASDALRRLAARSIVGKAIVLPQE